MPKKVERSVTTTAYIEKFKGSVLVALHDIAISPSVNFGDTAKPSDKIIAPKICLKIKAKNSIHMYTSYDKIKKLNLR